jgi:hypothetical protein
VKAIVLAEKLYLFTVVPTLLGPAHTVVTVAKNFTAVSIDWDIDFTVIALD